jgi:hypothetical protein
MSTITRKWIIAGVLFLTVLVLAAGTWLIAQFFFTPMWAMPGSMMDRSWLRGSRYEGRTFSSVGEQIYYTGTSSSGPRITVQMPMMGGRMACVDCHGENGEGGTLRMMMGTVEVPNIQYEHLTEVDHGEGADEHPPYNDETIKRAITEGFNPAGDRLDWPMPVWNMSDEQLNELIMFLKTLH